jgi:AraC-like DNA-binding protein
MDAQLAFFAIDVATAFAAALLFLRVLTQRPRLPAAQLVAAIAFNSVCDVVLGRSDYGYWIPPALRIAVPGGLAVAFNLARNSTPFLFAALCCALYADGKRFPRWLYALFALQLFFEEPVRLFATNALLTQAAPALLQTFFVGVALYWTLADWQNDLIETRRRTRILTAAAIGVSLVASGLGLRVLIDPNTALNYHAHVAMNFSHLVLIVFVLFQMTETGIDAYLDPLRLRAPPSPPPAANPDAAALARLAALMEVEHFYRRPGLTLAALAQKAGVPAYRLRRMIHEQLGFANFNAYLHAWRIREACAQMRDPAQRRTPILTIALSVGYRSVNTFNRGFRDVMDTTPSAWRASASSGEAVGQRNESAAPPPKSAILP